jgi:hypothetical protein
MAHGESTAHRDLKRLAVGWSLANGFSLVGLEISVPRSQFRADVAAATPHCLSPAARVALFECKQSRPDLLRDNSHEPDLRTAAAAAADRLRALRDLLGSHRPDLRRGDMLFPEFAEFDFGSLRHAGLRRVEKQCAVLQRKLGLAVKFSRLARYRAADHLYLVTEPDLVAESELPPNWGWLVRVDDGLELRRPPVRLQTTPEMRIAWVEQLARAGSRELLRREGIADPRWAAEEPAG